MRFDGGLVMIISPKSALSVFLLGVVVFPGLSEAAESAAKIIELTQVPCQFVESESVDHAFKTTQKADCEAINGRTGAERLVKALPLVLKPGKYVFRVTNKNVPYELGFWVREKGYDWRNPVHKLTKSSISGGGLFAGATQDYAVDLKAGEYLYSCPLNTTPDYKLVVKEE
jgi:hypothetical protein